ncbi:DUF4232 domain-containing protein [Streptomyces actinomycinicus]|uniref:DUF4232 domain-containing protein n=1 Tax=Streptomyces actinomycinicus TaxID=1695166 RepID=A0A937EGH2_9ACTN|nr:DUF4232 domain-containing protein [Streptomyces actinomycinicus]MBL1081695.1 DUF4232 domain-containing protein [Streptomyces actinomycinicus]
MRHIRLLAATGTAVAALALTACGSGTGTEDEGASRPTTPSAGAEQAASQTPGAAAGDTGDRTAKGTPVTRTHAPGARPSASAGHSTKGTGTGSSTGRSVVLCNGTNTTVTARPLARPLNHMLLTVKNTSRKTCELPYYPVLRFDEMQWVPQADEDTQPQAVVTLAPGESGYAMALLSAADGSGTGGRTAHKLTLAFQGYTPNSSGGPSATPALPAKGVFYDSALKVTYWQQDLGLISGW